MYHKSITEGQKIYSFELLYRHGLVSEITSLCVFLMMRLESFLLASVAKSLALNKCFYCFVLVFVPMGHLNFRKMQILLYMEKPTSYKIKLESFKLPRSVFSRLEISMVLIELFVLSFQ